MEDLINAVLTKLTAKAEAAAERLLEQPEGRGPERFPVLGKSFPALSVEEMHQILHAVHVLGQNARAVLTAVHPTYRGQGPRGIRLIERGLVELYLTGHKDLYACAAHYDVVELFPGTPHFVMMSDADLWQEYRIASNTLQYVSRQKTTCLNAKFNEVLARSPSLDSEVTQTQIAVAHIRVRKLGKTGGLALATIADVLAELDRRRVTKVHPQVAASTPENRLLMLRQRRDHISYALRQMLENDVRLINRAMTTVGAVVGYIQKHGDAGLKVVLDRLRLKSYSPEASLIALGTRLARILEVTALSQIDETTTESRLRNNHRQVEDWLDPFDFAIASGFGLDFEEHLRGATWFTSSNWKSIKACMAKLDVA